MPKSVSATRGRPLEGLGRWIRIMKTVVASGALLALWATAGEAQCVLCGDDDPPYLTISPAAGTFNSADQFVTIDYCDDNNLNSATREITLNGQDVTGQFGYHTPSSNPCASGETWARDTATVTLAEGGNTLEADICDLADQCASDPASYTLDTGAPTVTITPSGGTYNEADLSVTVDWCDDQSLDGSSRQIWLNGNDVTSDFSYTSGSASCGDSKTSNGTVTLDAGENTLTASIEDEAGNSDSASTTYSYDVPEPPEVDASAHNGAYRDVAKCVADCYEASVSYATPAYVSLDRPRTLALVYRSGQAAPKGFLELDVRRPPGTPVPDEFSVRLERPDGSWVTFANGHQEIYWQGDGGWKRLAVQFDAGGLSTGAHDYTAHVKSWFGSVTKVTTVPVRVLVVNEQGSPYGAGWSVAGLQRLHFEGSGDIVVTEGDGSVAFFAQTSGTTWSSPDGDFTELTENAAGDYERRYPDGTVLTFDASGRLDSVADRFGNTTSYGYSSGKLASVTDPAGKQITLGYGTDGKLAWIDGAGGRRTTVTVDGSGDLTAIEDPAGGFALQASYEASHRMSDRTDRRGGSWGFAYDGVGELAADTLPEVEVDGTLARPVVAFRSTASQLLAYLEAGTGTASSPAAPVASSAVEATVTDVRGQMTAYEVDRFGAPTRIEEPLGRTTLITRNADGLATSRITPAGDTIDQTWSGPDLVERTRRSTGRTVNVTYESTYHLPTHIFPDFGEEDVVERRFYYTAGRLDSLRVGGSGSPTVTRFTHDARGRVTTITDPEGHADSLFYASGGYLNTDSTVAEGHRRTAFGYDDKGRRVRTITPGDDTTRVAYDTLNRVVQRINGNGDTTEVTYDALYRTGVTDAEGQSWSWSPNALGWVTARTDPRGNTDAYEHDAAGQVTKVTDRRGAVVTFSYDALGNLDARTAGGATTDYGTDPDGRWVMASNAASTDTIRFDVAGRPVEQVTVRGGTTYRLQSTYGGEGRRTKLAVTAPFSRQIRYVRDEFGQLDTLVAIDGTATTRHYNADRQGIQVRYPTGDTLFRRFASTHRAGIFNWSDTELRGAFYTSYELDERSRVKSRRLGVLDTLRTYAYDAASQMVAADDSVLELATADCSWEADSGNVCGSENTTLARSRTYGYDGVGNRTDSGASLETGNRLVAFDGYTLSWDSAGHLVSKTGNGLSQSFHWSATGRLDSVTTDGAVTRYSYDGFGRRIEVAGPGGTRQFVHDGEDVLLELDGADSLVAEYTHFPGIDRPHSMRRGGVNYYYATNELGTVRGLFDAAGVVNEYRYEPFGQPSVLAEGVESPYRFTGRAWDTGPELYYYRARYYDPDLGRFISEDPIGLAGGINPYVYVGNDPINARDPSGLGECWRTLTGTYVCESVGVTVEGPAEEENTSGDTGAGDQFPTVPGRGAGPNGGVDTRSPDIDTVAREGPDPQDDACTIKGILSEGGIFANVFAASGAVIGGYVGYVGGSIPVLASAGATGGLTLGFAPIAGPAGAVGGVAVGATVGYKAGSAWDVIIQFVHNCILTD